MAETSPHLEAGPDLELTHEELLRLRDELAAQVVCLEALAVVAQAENTLLREQAGLRSQTVVHL